MHHEGHPSLPPIHELGLDLLHTSQARRILALALPWASAAAYFVFALTGHWVPAVFAVGALSFFTYGSTSHDLVHGNLGLPAWADEVLLSLTELLALRSGHAYRISHLAHHRHFPDGDDAEGAPAHWPLYRALAVGPVYLPWLWLWSLKRAHHERLWIAAETALVVAFWTAALLLRNTAPALLVYAVLLYLVSWAFPLGLVYLQHDAGGKDALHQTRRYRGRVVPMLLLQHLFHLEHHLYPMVPVQHWRALADRLDPHLDAAGIRVVSIL